MEEKPLMINDDNVRKQEYSLFLSVSRSLGGETIVCASMHLELNSFRMKCNRFIEWQSTKLLSFRQKYLYDKTMDQQEMP